MAKLPGLLASIAFAAMVTGCATPPAPPIGSPRREAPRSEASAASPVPTVGAPAAAKVKRVDEEGGLAQAPTFEAGLAELYRTPLALDFSDASLRQVLDTIARGAGLHLVFDPDVRLDQKTSIILKDTTVEAALHLALASGQLARRPLSPDTLLIFPNTPAKLHELQETLVKVFFLGYADATAVGASLRTLLKLRDVAIDERRNLVIIRAPDEVIRLAEKIVAIHDVAEPEVALDVEAIEVDRDALRKLGVGWPAKVDLGALRGAAGALTLDDLHRLGPSRIGIGHVALGLAANDTDTASRLLAKLRLLVRNRVKANLSMGDRVPNITATTGQDGFTGSTINYLDVGFKLELEPSVQLDDDVELKLALEMSSVVGQSASRAGTLAYQLGNRSAISAVRLHDGQTQIFAGFSRHDAGTNEGKLPAAGELPLLGTFFGQASRDGRHREIVFAVTPHVVRNVVRREAAAVEFASGAEDGFRALPPAHRASAGAQTAAANQPPPDQAADAAANAPSLAKLRWHGPAAARVGDVVDLALEVQTEEMLKSASMVVHFDPNLLRLTAAPEGGYFKQTDVQTNFNVRVDPHGLVVVNIARNATTGANGTGNVFSLRFRALAPSPRAIIDIDGLELIDADGGAVPSASPAAHAMEIR